MKNTVYYLLTIMVALVFVLTACAAPQKAASTPTPVVERPAAEKPQLTRQQQLIEGAKKEGVVELWTMSWPREAGIEKAFEARYPFLKLKVGDGPTGVGITAKIVEEAKVGRYSVDAVIFGDADIVGTHSAGVLQEYDWPKGWSGQPSHKYWLNVGWAAYFPVYNTDLVSAAEAPKTYEDLKNPKWRGKAMISTSGRGIPLYTGWILGGGKLDFDKVESFWKEVVANTRPRVMSGYTGPLASIAAGEVPLFLMAASSSTLNLMRLGAPIAPAALESTPIMGYSLALVKNAPHPNAVQLLFDFFTGPEGNLLYADAQRNGAYNPEVADKALASATFKKLGMKLVPIPADVYTDENVARASRFWAVDLNR